MATATQLTDDAPLLPLSLGRTLFPPSPSGKPVSVATLRRWHAKGVRGVKLQLERVGGRLFVSRDEAERFIAACNGRSVAKPSATQGGPAASPAPPNRAGNKRRLKKVQRLLAARGYRGEEAKRQVLGL